MGHGPVSSAACGLTAVRELLSSFHLLDSRRTRVMQSASLIRLKQKGTLKQSAERTTNKGKDEMETGGGGGGGGVCRREIRLRNLYRSCLLLPRHCYVGNNSLQSRVTTVFSQALYPALALMWKPLTSVCADRVRVIVRVRRR